MKVSVSLIKNGNGLDVFVLDENGEYTEDDYIFKTEKLLLSDIEIVGNTLIGNIINVKQLEEFECEDSIFYKLKFADDYSQYLIFQSHDLKQASYKYDYGVIELSEVGYVDLYVSILENEKFQTYSSLTVYNEINKDNPIYPKCDDVSKTFIHVRHGVNGCSSCNFEKFTQINYFKETPNGLVNVYGGVTHHSIKTLEEYVYGLKDDPYSLKHEIIRFGDKNEW